MPAEMSESRGNPGPVGITTSEAVGNLPVPQRGPLTPGAAPEPLPAPTSHRRRNTIGGGLIAGGTALAIAFASRFGGQKPSNPEITPGLPGGIVEPSLTGGMPSATAPINTPEASYNLSTPPAVTPSPSEMPTPNTEPSPSSSPVSSSTGSPEANQTPEPVSTNDLLAIVEQYAQFDPGGKLSDKTGDFNLQFSRSVLAKADVASISLSPDIMQKAHDIIIAGTYRAVSKAPGSELQLGAQTGQNFVSVPSFDDIVGIIVSPEEYTEINSSREQNNIPYGAGGDGGILFVKDKTLYAIEASSGSDGLWSVPAGWNKVGGGSRVAFDGFGHLYLDLAVAAQWRYLNPPFTNPNNIGEYNAVGITVKNYQLSDGDFQMVYNNN